MNKNLLLLTIKYQTCSWYKNAKQCCRKKYRTVHVCYRFEQLALKPIPSLLQVSAITDVESDRPPMDLFKAIFAETDCSSSSSSDEEEDLADDQKSTVTVGAARFSSALTFLDTRQDVTADSVATDVVGLRLAPEKSLNNLITSSSKGQLSLWDLIIFSKNLLALAWLLVNLIFDKVGLIGLSVS